MPILGCGRWSCIAMFVGALDTEVYFHPFILLRLQHKSDICTSWIPNNLLTNLEVWIPKMTAPFLHVNVMLSNKLLFWFQLKSMNQKLRLILFNDFFFFLFNYDVKCREFSYCGHDDNVVLVITNTTCQ